MPSLSELKGRYVTLHYTVLDIDIERVDGVVEEVTEDYITLRRGDGRVTLNLRLVAVYRVDDHGPARCGEE